MRPDVRGADKRTLCVCLIRQSPGCIPPTLGFNICQSIENRYGSLTVQPSKHHLAPCPSMKSGRCAWNLNQGYDLYGV
jgi:hypothetical protein